MNRNREQVGPETRTHEKTETYEASTPSERGVQWIGAVGADDANDHYDNVPCTD